MKKTNEEFIVKSIQPPPGRPDALTVGLPGLGLVGAGASSLLLKRAKGAPVKVASIIFSRMLGVIVLNGGNVAVTNDFSLEYVEPSEGTSGLLVLHGRAQPTSSHSQFLLAESTLTIARNLGISWVLTMGGYQVPEVHEDRLVYMASNDLLTYKLGIEMGMRRLAGQVTGAAGVIAGLSKHMGFHGGCILAETDGKPPDTRASEAVYSGLVRLLSKIGQLVPP